MSLSLKPNIQTSMFPPVLLSRQFLSALLAIAFTTSWLLAAPYGPDGMGIEWTQPDGTKLSLRVFGDEFYGRTETLDGYTVVFDEPTKSYHYADTSEDGQELISTGMALGKGNPQTLGLAKHQDILPAARKIKAAARFQEWDQVTQNSQRWAELKAERQAYNEAVQAAKDEGGPMPAPPSFTTIGEKVGLTLLIDFSDDPATIPQASIVDYCNGDNYTGYGNKGSVKKYFQDNSNNLLTYTNTVTAYIRMAQPKTYYNDTTKDSGAQGRLLINDAINIMKALPNYATEILPLFDTLTVDGSNRVAACNVFYAGGNGGKWSYGLWPHSWSLASSKELSAGGKKVYKYQITNLGSSLTLGTFCHENGHMLCGYPDIYDYDYDSTGGAGGFCLMNSGGHGTNPVLINAYLKRASGWTTTTELTSSSSLMGTLTATVGHADYNKIYRYANPGNAKEYFLFENRQKTGRDANIAASGIAIWHIDEQGNHNNQSLVNNTTHANYECSLIQADNLWHFQSNTNGGDSKDLYYLGNTAAAYTNTFNDLSSPDAKWWNGASSGLNVFNFSSAGATMTLQFGLPANTITVTAPNGGEQVYFNSTQNITWLSNTSGNVKIELFKSGALHTVLSASETNDGSYSWLVSPGLPAGNDYTIKISSVATPAYTDSSNATFTLAVQPTLADALDTTGLTWTNSGNGNWFAQFTTTKDGIDAAQSGAIGDLQNSNMETIVTGPGTLTFWWKISSETNYDFLRFYLNGTEQTGSLARISGTVDWVQKTVSIPSGNHTVKWGYTKDVNVVAGSDAAWVDQVVYTPSTTPEIAVEHPPGTNLVDGIASVDCGTMAVSGSSAPITFTVTNSGDGNLTGLVLSKDGSHSADFTLGSLGATTVAPGASTTFTVTFSPSAGGARSAAIHLASNDADENPFDIELTGTGVTVGTLAVSPAGNLTASGSVGGPFSPTSLPYTLSNPGSTSIDWTAAKTAAWMDLDATSGTLAPGANTIVTVSINTTADSLPINSYINTVTFTNTSNGNGDTTRSVSLDVNPIPAMVTIGDLSQTYSPSTPRSVSVTTDPPGLAHTVTYNGSPTPPTDAGTYAVVATITEPNYIGSDSEDLIIGKAPQIITFTAIPDVTDIDAPFALGATATSGLPVSYSSSSTAIASVDGNTVTIAGLGTTTITASQAGNNNYAAAIAVPQTLTVVRANPLAIITGDPYKVLIGQTLSLIGSASHPSHGNTITSYGWDLNGDDDYSDATGATPSAISVAELISTWGMTQGLNTIQLKVTDSASKTSIVSATVEVILSLTWDSNNTGANRTDGGGAWLGANQWWDGSANVTWASGSSVTFGNTGAGGAVTLASPTAVNTLAFNVFTGSYTLGSAGQAITLNGGIAKNSGSAAVTIISPITLGGAQTWTNNSATSSTLTASGGLNNGGALLTIDGTGITSFGNTTSFITGLGGITKNGTGQLILSGAGTQPAHNHSGTTTINGGSILIQNGNNSTGTGNVTLNGGVLQYYFGGSYTRALGSAGGEIQITGGTSGFSGQGATSTTFTTGASVTWGTATFNPTEFVLQTSSANVNGKSTYSSNINLNGANRTIRSDLGTSDIAGAGTFSGVISNSTGTAGLIKTGIGHHILSNAANSYNGATIINGGILTVGSLASININSSIGKGSVGGSAADLVLNGGTLRYANTASATTNRLFSVGTSGGSIDSSAASATNTLSFTGTGAMGFNSQSGTRTLTLTGSNTGNNTIALLIGDDGANATSLTKSGTGTWFLSNAGNNYTGATTIGGGSLQGVIPGGIGTTGGTSALIFNGGVLGLAAGDFTRSLGSNTTVTAVNFTGAGGWAAYGADRNVNLGGASAEIIWATADTGFNAKTLILGAATATHKVTLQNGLNLGTTARTVQTDDGSAAVDGELSGVITGSAGGGLIKTGAGVLSLSNANTYIGVTTVNAGVLRLDNVTALPGGIAASGGTGALVFTGGVLGLSNGNFARPLGTNATANAVNFTNAGGWAAYGADRTVNLGGASSTITWATANTGFNAQTLILGAASATHTVDLLNSLELGNTTRTVQADNGTAAVDGRLSGNITGTGGILSKSGAGTLALGGTNSYTGITNLAAVSGGRLIFQGSQSLSSGTSIVFNQSSSAVQSISLLDDDSGTLNFNRPISLTGTNTIQVMGIFVGNNSTANGGTSSGTTSGSTIQVGNITHTGIASDTGTLSINVTGANNYRLQTGTITLNNLVTRTANNTTTTVLNPTSANMTVAAITMASGNTGIANDGVPVLRFDGTSTDNYVTGTISNASDYLTGQALSLQKQGTSTWTFTGTNTYTGATTITTGTLQLGDGTSGKDGTIENTSTITNNATLVFNRFGNVSSNVGISGTGAVTKIGAGSQTLAGTNTYTGVTTASVGKLFINGSLSNTAVALNVSGGATLGGTGIIGRNVTIAAGGKLEFNLSTAAANHDGLDISSGRSFAFSGASELTITSSGGMAPGIYTLITGGNAITGVAPATVNMPAGWAATASISGNSLLLYVIGPVDHFSISSIASPQTIGTPITGITITAQDVSNQTVTSFTGTVTFGGTAGVAGTSPSFAAGMLSGVSVTPTAAGSNRTFTVDDGSGHTGSATFNVLTLYESWANTNSLTGNDALSSNNPDNDGLTNLQEFAFGANPGLSTLGSISFIVGGSVTSPGLPVVRNFAVGEGVDYRAVFGRRKNHAAAGLNYTVEFSADLNNWLSSQDTPTVITGENSNGDIEAVSVPYPMFVPTESGFKKPSFFRVGVGEN